MRADDRTCETVRNLDKLLELGTLDLLLCHDVLSMKLFYITRRC